MTKTKSKTQGIEAGVPSFEAMEQLVAKLRGIAPKRALTYGQSLQIARLQAAKLRDWAAEWLNRELDINLAWLVHQEYLPVSFVGSYKIGEHSGLTTDQVDGQLRMFINGNEPPLRQRFSLLHEFKHALDFYDARLLHADLGNGDHEIKSGQIEAIANDFAAHVLMPTPLVKRAWFRWQELSIMANLFNVSREAMKCRLTKLGIWASRSLFRACTSGDP